MRLAGWFARVGPPPDVFAVVMGTAIVSLAADQHGYSRMGTALGVLALAVFGLLGVGVLVSVVAGPGKAVRSVRDPDVVLRMFSFVAACAVLATRFGGGGAIGGLWVLGAVWWLVLLPLAVRAVSSVALTRLREHARGAWLLPSVATSGLAAVTAQWAVRISAPWLEWVAVSAWLLAVVIYFAVATLIGWRALAAPFMPRQAAPDSWILMGALAICALAGTHILTAARALVEPEGVARTAAVLTVGAWIAASLWIPPLLCGQLWRVDHKPGALRYDRVWWSGVFPIGMYSAASSATARTLGMPALTTVSLVFFWIAFAIWVILAFGLVHTSLAGIKRGTA